MNTLKIGSKGEEVKLLQLKLNITADGVFGSNTEKAVKEFQKKNNLTADGIVGNNTWKALGVVSSSNTKAVDSCVVYNPLNVHISKLANRDIKYIALHYTAGGSSIAGRANGTKNTFEKRQASADFCVDDATIVQFNPDINNYYCWAVGDKKNPYSKGGSLNGKAYNRNTISIEMCSTLKSGTSASAANHEGWSISDKVLSNTLKLVKILMKKFNIPKDRVVRHYDITGKLCPGVLGWNNEKIYDIKGNSTNKYTDSSKWLKFKNSL